MDIMLGKGENMKKKKVFNLLLIVVMLINLTACFNGAQPDIIPVPEQGTELPEKEPESSVSEKKPVKPDPVVAEPSISVPAQKRPISWVNTWIMTREIENGEERIYRLILSEDGTAQLPIQDGIGILKDLGYGTWEAEKDILTLNMELDSAYRGYYPKNWKSVGGRYRCKIDNTDFLVLTELDNPYPIVPEETGKTLTFESDSHRFQREEMEFYICNAVRQYYEAVSGETYPGYVDVYSRNTDGTLTIQVYEDMGDHTATVAWYTVNPNTYQGTDDIFGTEIDFTPYREEETS